MEALIIVMLLAVIGLGAIALAFLSQQRRPQTNPVLDQHLAALRAELAQANATTQQAVGQSERTVLQQVSTIDVKMNQRLDSMQNTVDQRLNAVDNRLGQSMTSTQETIGRIGEQLGGLDQAAKRIMEVGKDVSSLKEVLQPPKLRGAFGELLLDQLLKQVIPAAHYQMQHRFRDGTIVDAIIRTPDGLVPVDSKFPIDSYRRLLAADSDEERARLRRAFIRDVRLRVEEVAKYIRPDEGTLDFACMYIPAEGIFYEVIAGGSDEDAMTFALERQVHLVSPNTFFALLQVVGRGLARLQVQEDVKEFQARVSQVRRDFTKFREEFNRLGNHLSHAKNKYDELDRWTEKLDTRLAASAHEPVQQPLLPEPQEIAAQSTLPRPASVGNGNGHDDL